MWGLIEFLQLSRYKWKLVVPPSWAQYIYTFCHPLNWLRIGITIWGLDKEKVYDDVDDNNDNNDDVDNDDHDIDHEKVYNDVDDNNDINDDVDDDDQDIDNTNDDDYVTNNDDDDFEQFRTGINTAAYMRTVQAKQHANTSLKDFQRIVGIKRRSMSLSQINWIILNL